MDEKITDIIHVLGTATGHMGFVNVWRGSHLTCIHEHDTGRYDYWVKRAQEWKQRQTNTDRDST